VRLINALFSQAVREGASDIHVEAFEGRSWCVPQGRDAARRDRAAASWCHRRDRLSRIQKHIMARLDIAEKRQPHGRPHTRCGSPGARSTCAFRFCRRLTASAWCCDCSTSRPGGSTLPASAWRIRLSPHLRELVRQPHGIILVTGPTGSGKTTTLYAAIGQLDAKRNQHPVTVEDPIEYDLDGVGQTQVNPRIELTFARALLAPSAPGPGRRHDREIARLETRRSRCRRA